MKLLFILTTTRNDLTCCYLVEGPEHQIMRLAEIVDNSLVTFIRGHAHERLMVKLFGGLVLENQGWSISQTNTLEARDCGELCTSLEELATLTRGLNFDTQQRVPAVNKELVNGTIRRVLFCRLP